MNTQPFTNISTTHNSKIIMINSFAGYGKCSTTIALPIISVMGVQVSPVPTSILSNHLGFPTCFFQDFTPHMSEYLGTWEKLNLEFDGLYCGFLGSIDQIAIIIDLFKKNKVSKGSTNKESKKNDFQKVNLLKEPCVILIDPVMGDHGKTYSSISPEHCQSMKELVQYADILTPNITEACLLTDTPYKESNWSLEELESLCCKLDPKKSKRIVLTGIPTPSTLLNFVWENGTIDRYESKIIGKPHHGTGDIFASILIADAVNGLSFIQSVKKAADFIAICIADTEESGIPEQDGVLFERNLYRLLH